jgi:uncharacterized membrane protein
MTIPCLVRIWKMSLVSSLLSAHVAFGSLALLTFALPLIVRKGGRLHIVFGRGYILGMCGIVVTATGIALIRIFYEPNLTHEQRNFAVFLLMIALFAASAVWTGVRVLRFKGRTKRHSHRVDLGFTWLRILAGIAVSLFGFIQQSPLLAWFSIVPIVTGVLELKYWLGEPQEKMHWWFQHMTSMFTACIATVTAFVVTAIPRLLGSSNQSILLWFAPTLILLPLLKAMQYYYRKKFTVSKLGPMPDAGQG